MLRLRTKRHLTCPTCLIGVIFHDADGMRCAKCGRSWLSDAKLASERRVDEEARKRSLDQALWEERMRCAAAICRYCQRDQAGSFRHAIFVPVHPVWSNGQLSHGVTVTEPSYWGNLAYRKTVQKTYNVTCKAAAIWEKHVPKPAPVQP